MSISLAKNLNMLNSENRAKEAKAILTDMGNQLLSTEIDTEDFSKAIDEIIKCKEHKGKILTTGMGKAGIVAKKFSSTLCSLSFPSCNLHPGEASHGDLGIISRNDIIFVFSTSGKTREVLDTIDLSRKMGVYTVIGVTSHPDSPIREKADIVVDMGEMSEAGHLGLAPTTSINTMLALTDCLALVSAKEIEITPEDFHLRHHSGYLGEKTKN
jgi:arabinose-5-phosphate isomerase